MREPLARWRRAAAGRRRKTAGFGVVLIGFLIWLWPDLASAANRAIERISTRSQDGSIAIRIELGTKLRYVTHLPGREGSQLFIHLRPTEDFGPNGAPIRRSEEQIWRPTAELPLTRVRYDAGLPTGPGLILTFQRPVRFAVSGSRDDRSVTVTVEKPAVAAAPAAPPRPEAAASLAFAVELARSPKPFDPKALPDIESLRAGRLYVVERRKGGSVEHSLRLGFFSSRDAAERVIADVHPRFPDAKAVQVTFEERRASSESAIDLGGPATAPPGANLPPLSREQLAEIDREARAAMTKGDLDRAVSLLTKLLEYPNHPYRQEAQELLGLARERKGQVAHAKAEYEKYLKEYPSGEGAARVRQRLSALLTAREQPRAKLREAKREVEGKRWQTQLYGSFSQYYARQDRFTDLEGVVTDRSDLFTDLDVTARAFDDNYDIRAVFVGGHAYNFLAADRENTGRISNLFVDARLQPIGLSMRAGRQTQSTGGVLGRFDGGLLTQRLSPTVAVNVVGGFLVASTTDLGVGMDRPFYGASIDLGRFADHWDFNVFAINQETSGILDRRAVGLETRFTAAGRGSFFSLLDYDVSYHALNIALLTGNVTFADTTTVNLILDYRRSPILTTTNGVQGQASADVGVLLQTISESQLRQFARDRTATSRSATIGISHQLNKVFQISGDVTVSRLSSTKASGGVDAVPGTGYEFFYSAQLVAINLLRRDDVTIFGVAFADTGQSNTASLTLNTRFPITQRFRVIPRFRFDYRWKDVDSTQKRIRVQPSFKLDYRLTRNAHLELEAGGEWVTERFVDTTDQTTDFYVIAGYRVDF